jgi:hypothetical protein
LQDIPTGAQRSEIVTVNGEPSATPTAPEAPTAPELNTDILLQVVPLASVTVTEGAMVMTDLTIAYEMVTPSELEAVETIATGAQETAGNAQTTANTASTNATNALNMIRSTSSDAYSSSKAYSVGDHVIYNNKVYKCITACSAGSWSTNRSCFEQTTLMGAVTDLNSALSDLEEAVGNNISYYKSVGLGSKSIAAGSNGYFDTGVNSNRYPNVFFVAARAISSGASAVLFNWTIGSNGNFYVVGHNYEGSAFNGTIICYFFERGHE